MNWDRQLAKVFARMKLKSAQRQVGLLYKNKLMPRVKGKSQFALQWQMLISPEVFKVIWPSHSFKSQTGDDKCATNEASAFYLSLSPVKDL